MARMNTWMGRRASFPPAARPLCGYLALSLLYFLPAWLHPRHVWIGSGSDTDLLMWSVRWTPYAVTHGLNPFYTTHLNYPTGVNLAWNPTMPLAGLVLWPITALAGPIASYNTLVTLGFAGSSWCAYLALVRWLRFRVVAFVAALAYGFSPYMTTQVIAHGNLVLAFAPPLLLLTLDEILVRPQRSAVRLGLLLGGLLAGQFLLFPEIAAGSVIVGALGAAVLCAFAFRSISRARALYALRCVTVAAVLLAAVIGPIVAWQFLGPRHITGPVHETGVFVTDLLAPITPTRAQAIAPSAAVQVTQRFTGNLTEWNGYLGLPLVLFAVAAALVLWRRHLLVRVAALTGLVTFVLSLGPQLHVGGRVTGVWLPWQVLGRIPGLDSILPARLALFVSLCAALLLGFGLDAVWSSSLRRRWRRVAVPALATAALVPLVPRLPVPTSTAPVPVAFSQEAARDIPAGSAVLVFPVPQWCDFQPFRSDHPCASTDPMLWQAVAGMRFRMPGGYYAGPLSPLVPPSPIATVAATAPHHLPAVTDALRASLLGNLRAWRITAVLVGPGSGDPQGLQTFWTAVLGRSPRQTGGVELWTVPAA